MTDENKIAIARLYKSDATGLDMNWVYIAPEPSGQRSAREERIIAGFEEIERFVEEHGRLPQHGDDRDIFEWLYAVRLDRLRESDMDFGPLFANNVEAANDLPTGYIYVLRSKSEHPFIAKNRSVNHKIGITGGDVKNRIANAKKDPTYLRLPIYWNYQKNNNVLKVRSNEWGDILPTVITNLLELPTEQLRVLLSQLPQLSIDELIALIIDS